MDASVRTRLSRDDRMEQTLGAAHGLFAERGYAAVTMDEIAAAVGVTKPLLYNYFGNKEQLYIACMERAGDSLIKTIAESVGESANPGDALGAGVRAFFEFLDTDRAAWAVLFDETLPHGGRGGALRRDPPPRRRGLRPGRRLPRPDRRPRLRHAGAAAAGPPPGQGRNRGPLHRSPGRRRGARPLVAAHRGDLCRGCGRAARLHRGAGA